jgi:hypothetical protein
MWAKTHDGASLTLYSLFIIDVSSYVPRRERVSKRGTHLLEISETVRKVGFPLVGFPFIDRNLK